MSGKVVERDTEILPQLHGEKGVEHVTRPEIQHVEILRCFKKGGVFCAAILAFRHCGENMQAAEGKTHEQDNAEDALYIFLQLSRPLELKINEACGVIAAAPHAEKHDEKE